MPAPRLKYQEPDDWSRSSIENALAADRPEDLWRAVIAVSMHDEDWKYAQDLCVRLSRHRHFNVRGNAVLGFGHIARVHQKLDREVVSPIIEAALKDEEEYVRDHARSARDDTELFLLWKYESEG